MAEVDGKVIMQSPEGRLYQVPKEQVALQQQDQKWTVAPDEVAQARQAEREEYAKYGSTGQQALAAGEQVYRTATGGLLPGIGDAAEVAGRERVLRKESPVVSGAAQAVGTVLPALAGGALAEGAIGAAGLGAGELPAVGALGESMAVPTQGALGASARGAITAGAEGLGGGAADEVEQARYDSRGVSAGNIFLMGLGGAVIGHALPKALEMGAGKIRRALTPIEEAAGEGVPNALAEVESNSVRSQVNLAPELPKGSPERAETLRATAAEQYDRLAPKVADDLGAVVKTAREMGDSSGGKQVAERLRDAVPETSPAQVDWFTGMKQRLDGVKKELRAPIEGTAPSTVEDYLATVKGKAAKARAYDDLTDEVVARAKERGVSLGGAAPGAASPEAAAAAASDAARAASGTAAAPADEASIAYALDAARRRLRGVADHSQNAELDALVGQIGERTPEMRGLPDDVKLAINQRTGKAPLEQVTEWVRDPDALRQAMGHAPAPLAEGAGEAAGQAVGSATAAAADDEGLRKIWREVLAEKGARRADTLASATGFGDAARDIDRIIDTGLRRLDKTTSTAEQFLAAREVRQRLERVGSALETSDAAHADAMRGLIEGAWQDVKKGLTDESLFGRAAQLERDLAGPWRDKISEGLGATESDLARKVSGSAAEFDPGKVRAFLKKDAVDQQLTRGKLESVLEGAEDLLSAHQQHGTWDGAQISAQRERIERVRSALGLSDEIRAAATSGKAAAAEAKAAASASKAAGAESGAAGAAGKGSHTMGELAEFGLEHIVNHAVPFGGSLLRLGKRLVGIDAAARAATKQAARNFAGAGLGYAARAAGRAAEVGIPVATTALSRFTGDYSGPAESFAAKQQLIDAAQASPDVLYETLAHSLGDLPKLHPEMFQEIARRTADKLRFVRDNLPPGIQASLLYPNGTPPGQSDLRDFATLWNTVMEPESVLHDMNAGTASPQQMRILEHSDPDVYANLRSDVLQEVSQNFARVPTATKLELDILFDADGLAGPMFSSAAADMMASAQQAEKTQRASGNAPTPSSGAGEIGRGSSPSGLSAIRSSVTNRGSA